MQKDINEIAGNLKAQLKRLEMVGNGAFKGMDPIKYSKVKDIHVDLNQAFKAAQNGDTSKLNDLSKKYASTN